MSTVLRTKLRKHGMRRKAHVAAKFVKNQFRNEIAKTEPFNKKEANEWGDQQDWEYLKDLFETKDNGGVFTYKTIQDFAKFQAKGDEDKERWLRKSIGVSPKNEIKWRGDWALERTVEYSKDLEHAKLLNERLEQDGLMLKMAIPVAASYRSWQTEVDKIRAALKDVLGEINEPRPKFKDDTAKEKWEMKQEKRIQKYFDWMRMLEEFKAKVDRHYLNALGFNKPNMVAMVQALILNKGNTGPNGMPDPKSISGREQNAASLASAVMSMEIEKAKMFDVPLPDDYLKLLEDGKDAVEEARDVTPKKKAKVN